MALFQYNNLLLPYQIHFAPFAFDMLLLQGSAHTSDYWLPVLNEWRGEPTGGGRVVTCDWQAHDMTGGDLAEYFHRFFLTLGLHDLRAVASDDARQLIRDIESDFPGVVIDSLLLRQPVPRGSDLRAEVEDFVGLGT